MVPALTIIPMITHIKFLKRTRILPVFYEQSFPIIEKNVGD
jgi:hypothetical protein